MATKTPLQSRFSARGEIPFRLRGIFFRYFSPFARDENPIPVFQTFSPGGSNQAFLLFLTIYAVIIYDLSIFFILLLLFILVNLVWNRRENYKKIVSSIEGNKAHETSAHA